MTDVKEDMVDVEKGTEIHLKMKDPNQLYLLPSGRSPNDYIKRVESKHRKVMLIVVFTNIVLCVLVIGLYIIMVKQQSGDGQGPHAVQSNVDTEQQAFTDQTPKPEQRKKDENNKVDSEQTANHEMVKDIHMHLIGIHPHLSLRSGNQGAQFVPLEIWSTMAKVDSTDHAIFTLINHTTIEIMEDGLYTIYGQLSWRKKLGQALYRIERFSKGSGSPEIMAQCSAYYQNLYAVLESCHTSVTTTLQRGDLLLLNILSNNLTIDFDNGKSFFGIVKMQRYSKDDFFH